MAEEGTKLLEQNSSQIPGPTLKWEKVENTKIKKRGRNIMTNDLLKPSKQPLKTYRQKIAFLFENVELEPDDKDYLAMVFSKETMAWGYAFNRPGVKS